MAPQLANGVYVSCTSAVLADTTQQLADATQESDFDVALYAVVGTILNGCERDALTTHIMQSQTPRTPHFDVYKAGEE